MVRVLDRLLLFLYTLIVGVISIYALLAAWNVVNLGKFVNRLNQDQLAAVSVIVIGIILLLISIRFFYISVRRSSSHAPSIDQRTAFGDVRISLDTIENMTLKAASRIRGVSEIKAKVNVSSAGLEIAIRLLVDGESPIPNLTEELQSMVKNHIEELSGIPVSDVSVFVTNIVQSHSFKSRVE
ncbi:MAG: hypothetical protein A2189_08185 [Paenibacillus sp. RIFOXYA1_FULL_44_5]|nr:MAG: hypothetical protein A2189_08185 [Paenibacillus sp. RIFOXYA1_FULL_44_5]